MGAPPKAPIFLFYAIIQSIICSMQKAILW